ncbi:MAG: hypothetical protein CL484_09855 [Acidobacteria bacterium]|nr:hypothetical protein [Acidobacteriota bacterium]
MFAHFDSRSGTETKRDMAWQLPTHRRQVFRRRQWERARAPGIRKWITDTVLNVRLSDWSRALTLNVGIGDTNMEVSTYAHSFL